MATTSEQHENLGASGSPERLAMLRRLNQGVETQPTVESGTNVVEKVAGRIEGNIRQRELLQGEYQVTQSANALPTYASTPSIPGAKLTYASVDHIDPKTKAYRMNDGMRMLRAEVQGDLEESVN